MLKLRVNDHAKTELQQSSTTILDKAHSQERIKAPLNLPVSALDCTPS